MGRKITAKIRAAVMEIRWLLFDYTFSHPEKFPEEISLIEYDGLFGLFCKSSSSLLTAIDYKKIVYDSKGNNFLAYNDRRTCLINMRGKIIFTAYKLPSDEVKEYLLTGWDGTYQHIVNNAMNGRGWSSIINSKGKIITKTEHLLER